MNNKKIFSTIQKREYEFPRFSFIIIVLNGMPFIEYAIKSVYDFAYEIIIVEGAVKNCMFAANQDGSSIDGTIETICNFPDNEDKIKLINGQWDEKVNMQNKALEYVTGDYIWLLDSDEIYHKHDLLKVKKLILEDKSITQVNFIGVNFWKGFDYIFISGKFFQKSAHWRRVFKFQKGAKFTSHRPPTIVLPGSSISTEKMNLLDGYRTREMGIIPFHYSYVLDNQVKQKIELYKRYGWGQMWGVDLDDWYENFFKQWTPENRQVLERQYPVWTGDINSRTIKFDGVHPLIMDKFIENFKLDRNNSGFQNKTGKFKIASDYAKEGMKVDDEAEFSCQIKSLIKEKRPKKIIETGTYLGTGTTSIITKSLQEFRIENVEFYTIEINPRYYQLARENLRKQGLLNYVCLLNGLSIPRKLLPTKKEIEEKFVNSSGCENIFVDHQEKDRATLYYSETDFAHLPDDLLGLCLRKFDYCPDFILLDSGGHMGNIEFKYLINNLQGKCYIALDDIYHVKHHQSFLQMQKDPRFTILISSEEKFGFCIAQFTPKVIKKENILWVRTDSIGDNVLAMSMLSHIRKKYPHARLTVLCQRHIAELYDACPHIDNIIAFDRKKSYEDERYRNKILEKIKDLNTDIVLNSVYSRELLGDFFAINNDAKERIAFEGNLCNITAKDRDRNNKHYTHILSSNEVHKPEIERHRDFLLGIGIDANSSILQPTIWTTPEDDSFANDFFMENNLQPTKTIAVFAGAQHKVRLYYRYGVALSQVCRDNNFTVISVGSKADYDINQKNLDSIDAKTINLCGKTTLRQTASLIKRCRLVVGAETGIAHIACAVGTPNIIIVGGGHFGRFLPYSHLTSIVCLPLDCYQCNWRCKHNRPYCIQDVDSEVISIAVQRTLNDNGSKPRCYIQGKSLFYHNSKVSLAWQSPEKFINTRDVDFFEINNMTSMREQLLEKALQRLENRDFVNARKCLEKVLKENSGDKSVAPCSAVLQMLEKNTTIDAEDMIFFLKPNLSDLKKKRVLKTEVMCYNP